MAKLVEKTYGDALFEAAVEGGKTEEFLEEAKSVKAAFEENGDMLLLLNNPNISKEDKTSFTEKVFKGRISDDISGLLVLMIKKGRQKEIIRVCDYFIEKVKEYNKIGTAYVTSAAPLRDEQKRSIYDRLLSSTQYEDFEIHYAVDEKLIGGMVVRIGDRVVDGSIKMKLDNMSKSLYKIQLT